MYQSRNLNKLIVFSLIFLLVSMPFTLAQTETKEVGKEETGGLFSAEVPDESFTEGQFTNVNILVNRYEPTVLVSSVLEEQSIPVFAFLSATPTASTELPRIQRVSITEVTGNKSSTAGVRYYEPKVWSWSDIGYIELRLKKIEKEHKVPDKISVNLKARIEYEADINSDLIGGAQTITLDETPVVDLSKIITDQKYDLFGGKGHIALRQVSSKSAIFTIYDSEGKIISTATSSLGQDSAVVSLVPGSSLPENQVRIRLNKIIDKIQPNAVISIDNLDHTLVKGTKILDWSVSEIVITNPSYIKLTKIGTGEEVYLQTGKSSDIEKGYTAFTSKINSKFNILSFNKLKSDWGDFEVKEINTGKKPVANFKVGGKPGKTTIEEGKDIIDSKELTECTSLAKQNRCFLESVRGGNVLITHPDKTLDGKCTTKTTPLYLRNLDRKYLFEETVLPGEVILDTLPSKFCSQTIQLESIETQKSVEITILSGAKRGVTETQFALNIPIEKRPVKFSTKSISEQINKTQELIDRLTKTIDKLESVVETWTKICLITTAVFTIYNFIFGYGLGSQAPVTPTLTAGDVLSKSGLSADKDSKTCNEKGGFVKLKDKSNKFFYDSPTTKHNEIFINIKEGPPQYYYIENKEKNECDLIQNTVIYDSEGKPYIYNPSTEKIESTERGLSTEARENIQILKDDQGRNIVVIPIKSEQQFYASPVLKQQYEKEWKVKHGEAAGAYYISYYENDRVEVYRGIGNIDLISNPKEENDKRIDTATKNSGSSRVYLEVERVFIQGRIGPAQKRGFSNIDLFGEPYKIDTTKKLRINELKCEEVLGPVQCKLMYNACDPVICPASRCDLGGLYEVPDDNVIQSGLIGSFVLCAPNFVGFGGDVAVPICITGVLASLKNIRSYLQAYKACLITAKADDKAVGICDKIRSIFMCEIIWKEVMTLLNSRGGVLNFLTKKISGGSASDYLNMKPRVEGLKKTVDYFTNSYATTIFASYRGKTTDQIGAELCRSAIGGAFPNLGKLSELAKPEDPPQFSAIFEEHDYSPTLGASRYNVFYHIYAGTPREENQIINYQVFLKSQGLKDFLISQGSLKSGEFADESKDYIAPRGYQEICINLNGKVQCGFGKTVSSSFGINQIANTYIADNLASKITKASECIPSQQSSLSSYSAGFVPSAAVERRCSFSSPYLGLGNPKEKEWFIIGECGVDEKGNTIGKCWEHANLEKYPEIQSKVFKDSCEQNQNANLCHVYEKCIDGAVLAEFNIKSEGPLLSRALGEGTGDIGIRSCCTGTCRPFAPLLNDEIEKTIKSFGAAEKLGREMAKVAGLKEEAFKEDDVSETKSLLLKDAKFKLLLDEGKYNYLVALLILKYNKNYNSYLAELAKLEALKDTRLIQIEALKIILDFYATDKGLDSKTHSDINDLLKELEKAKTDKNIFIQEIKDEIEDAIKDKRWLNIAASSAPPTTTVPPTATTTPPSAPAATIAQKSEIIILTETTGASLYLQFVSDHWEASNDGSKFEQVSKFSTTPGLFENLINLLKNNNWQDGIQDIILIYRQPSITRLEYSTSTGYETLPNAEIDKLINVAKGTLP